MVSRAHTTHAAGGPATVAGVDYEIDCALADALELVEQHLSDPLCDGTIKLQARVGSAEVLTAWDYGAGPLMAVEVKRNATAADAAEWVARTRIAAASSSDGGFRLAYGNAVGSWEGTLSKFIALAKEADNDERLRELASNDRLDCPAWLEQPSMSILRRMELRRNDPAELGRVLMTRCRAIFAGKPEAAIPAMRDQLRNAARDRMTVRASALAAAVRAADVVPRELQATIAIDGGDARRVTLLLVSRCAVALPKELLRRLLGDRAAELEEGLRSLADSGFIMADDAGGMVTRVGQPPQLAASNGPAILDKALQLLLSAIQTGAPWAREASALRLACELCTMGSDVGMVTVATAFIVLDKHVKNLGDVRLVRRTAEACVAAAEKHQTAEARKGHAQALVCGVSWAKQRTGLLEAARGDAQQSREIGECLPWPRNTAFCCKCIGRLLRLEATAKPAGPDRTELLQKSVAELRAALERFAMLDDSTDAEREAERGACYSLLGRSFLELGERRAALEAIEQAKALIPESRRKDAADLWILRGEYEVRWGSPEYARAAFSHALEATDDPAFEVAEMRGRALEQRAKVAEGADMALTDLEQAHDVFARLGDADSAARAEFARMRLQGRVPKELEHQLNGESHAVSVRTVRLAEAERGPRGDAVAYRDAIPAKTAQNWISEARRQAVIEDAGASHVVAPRPPPRTRLKRTKQPLSAVLRRLAPRARDALQAARMLAAEIAGATSTLPVQLEPIARSVGVEEIRAVELGRNGELRIDEDALRIVHSRDLGKERRRFTVAHEIGHAVLISRSGALVTDGPDLERFCDAFASALLIPESMLPKLPATVSVEDLTDAARLFEVSLPVAAIRLQKARGGFQAICVEGDQVIWSAGELRRGRVAMLPDTIRDLVNAALEGSDTPREVFANLVAYGGLWSVSLRLSDASRLVVVLSPSRPVVRRRGR
jgi:tetratricopeptide (TPR) repeat protein